MKPGPDANPAFSAWKAEKAILTLIDEAQALADKLATVKPHILDSYAAHAQLWAATCLAEGQDLHALADWPPAAVTRFVRATQTKVAALRKQRLYASSDGLVLWLHTARALTEPRILPAARDLWQRLAEAGPNATSMAADLLQDAGLPPGPGPRVPKGFDAED